jgi:hypothetical protein
VIVTVKDVSKQMANVWGIAKRVFMEINVTNHVAPVRLLAIKTQETVHQMAV